MSSAGTTSAPMTADEFFALPDELPHAQLIDGVLIVNNPSAGHQRTIVRLLTSFHIWADERPELGDLGFEVAVPIDQHNVFLPDLWWVPADRRLRPEEHRFPEAPGLVAEVRSPSTWRYDVGVKLRRYEAAGVQELWLIDPSSATVIVHRRPSPDAPGFAEPFELTPPADLTTPLIPGWQIDLSHVFRP